MKKVQILTQFEHKRDPNWQHRATTNGKKGNLKRDPQKDTVKETLWGQHRAKMEPNCPGLKQIINSFKNTVSGEPAFS